MCCGVCSRARLALWLSFLIFPHFYRSQMGKMYGGHALRERVISKACVACACVCLRFLRTHENRSVFQLLIVIVVSVDFSHGLTIVWHSSVYSLIFQ